MFHIFSQRKAGSHRIGNLRNTKQVLEQHFDLFIQIFSYIYYYFIINIIIIVVIIIAVIIIIIIYQISILINLAIFLKSWELHF